MINLYYTFNWDGLWETIFGVTELWGVSMGFWVGIVLVILLVVILVLLFWFFPKKKEKPEKIKKTKQAKNK